MDELNLFKANNHYKYIFNEPLKFIDSLEKRKHIVLYYDNLMYGKKIQMKFIRNGLIKGEKCIYTTHNDDNIRLIENEMMNNGIDVKNYYKKGLLTIFIMPDLLEHPKGVLKGSEEIVDKMLSNLNPNKSFRLIIRMIDKLNTKDRIKYNLALEQYYHSKFDSFNGLVLCPYYVNQNPTNTNGKWVETILDNHHSAIFVTDIEDDSSIGFGGIAFDMI